MPLLVVAGDAEVVVGPPAKIIVDLHFAQRRSHQRHAAACLHQGQVGRQQCCRPPGLGVAIGELQLLAAELAAPILVINERNRGSAAGGGVNAAAGHRAIEYGAETVLSLNRETIKDNKGNDTHRPKPFDARGEVGAYIAIEKNRHGAGGRFEMTYCGRLQKFSEA